MNHRMLRRAAPLLLAVLLLVAILPATAFAHERRTIDNGKYDVVVGWDVEPAFVSQKNGATVRISQAGSNPAVPVTGADQTLKVSIRQGAQTKQFPLRAVFGQGGFYAADIVPEQVGDYQWSFVGTIGGDPINETFDSADGKFDGVQALSAIAFPVTASSDPAQIAADAQSARSDAQTARTLAVVGSVLGLLGLVAAGAMWLKRDRVTSRSGVARPVETA